MNNKLFTYGTLRVNQPNSAVIKNHSIFQTSCKSTEKYIMITQKNKKYPISIPVQYWPEMAHKATYISGDVYAITDVGIGYCDILEEHPTFYIRTPIKVINNSGKIIRAEAYIIAKEAFSTINKNNIVFIEGDWLNLT